MTTPTWTVAPNGKYHPDNFRELPKVAKALGRGFVPRSVGLQAAAMLAERARKVAREYGTSYRDAVALALEDMPSLRLGLRPLLPDDDFDGVTMVEARDDDES